MGSIAMPMAKRTPNVHTGLIWFKRDRRLSGPLPDVFETSAKGA